LKKIRPPTKKPAPAGFFVGATAHQGKWRAAQKTVDKVIYGSKIANIASQQNRDERKSVQGSEG
jgi:hypothetical protein